MNEETRFRAFAGGFRWAGVELHAYKDDGSAPFKDITRQTLFRTEDLAGELRRRCCWGSCSGCSVPTR